MFTLLFAISAVNSILGPIAAKQRVNRASKDGVLEVQRVTIAITNETIKSLREKGAYGDLLEALQREADLRAMGAA